MSWKNYLTQMPTLMMPFNVDTSKLVGKQYTDYAGYSYRIDGNNIDIDTENVELASNNTISDRNTEYNYGFYTFEISN